MKALHPDLPVDFGPLDWTPSLIRQNPELRGALIAGYVVLPFFISLTVWLALTASGDAIPLHKAAVVGGVALVAPLSSLALGFGAGLICCAFAGWGTLLRYATQALAGPACGGVALGIIEGALALALLNVFRVSALPGFRRETAAISAGVFASLGVQVLAGVAVANLFASGVRKMAAETGGNIPELSSSAWMGMVIAGVGGAAMIWIALAGAMTLRRGRWAEGATAGGVAAGAAFLTLITLQLYLRNSGVAFAPDAASDPHAPASAALAVGIGGTVTMATGRSLSFALAERMGGSVVAISSIIVTDGLAIVVDHAVRGDLHATYGLIFVAVVVAHLINRRRARRAPEAAENP